ncbi:hypothetical protein [Amycolatopsis sp. H20-H5]|uniref:hypothetical protein n=1 Tax=Amycolatopsis sp. H20-H5 TaxID=3046309 RepID=UPI002DC053CA|nr:hypothetical protein [Amycolatopsis sp. H20-H5]MEC3978793.1 hypothetical protein [Amycolatopsis sp. H20-H5]
MTAPGQWMATDPGTHHPERHYVSPGAIPWHAPDGWLMGHVSDCGVRCIAADTHYLANLTPCPSCATGHPS